MIRSKERILALKRTSNQFNVIKSDILMHIGKKFIYINERKHTQKCQIVKKIVLSFKNSLNSLKIMFWNFI